MNKPNVGDVYYDPEGLTNPLVLVKAAYSNEGYQLLGLGLSSNSNEFYRKTHTIGEIVEKLKDCGMIWIGNIDPDVENLVKDKVNEFKKNYTPKHGDVYVLASGAFVEVVEKNGRYRVIFSDFGYGDICSYNELIEYLRCKEAVFQRNISVDKLFS